LRIVRQGLGVGSTGRVHKARIKKVYHALESCGAKAVELRKKRRKQREEKERMLTMRVSAKGGDAPEKCSVKSH